MNRRAASTSTASRTSSSTVQLHGSLFSSSTPRRAMASITRPDRATPFYPIPEETKTQPHWIEGGPAGNVDLRSSADRHMLIVDRDARTLYELFNVYFDGTRWQAGSGAFFDLSRSDRRPDGLDVRRCRRPRHPARPGALRGSERAGRDRTRIPGHGAGDQRLRISGVPSCRVDGRARCRWGHGCG